MDRCFDPKISRALTIIPPVFHLKPSYRKIYAKDLSRSPDKVEVPDITERPNKFPTYPPLYHAWYYPITWPSHSTRSPVSRIDRINSKSDAAKTKKKKMEKESRKYPLKRLNLVNFQNSSVHGSSSQMIRRRINYRASLRNYNFHSARLPPSPLEKKKFDASISGQGEEERWIWGASPIGQTARIGEMKNCVDGCFFSNTTTSRRDARCGGGSFGRNERFGGRWPAVAGIRDFREALRDDGGGGTRDFGRGWTELALFTAINSLPLTANRLLPLAPLEPPSSIPLLSSSPVSRPFQRCFA